MELTEAYRDAMRDHIAGMPDWRLRAMVRRYREIIPRLKLLGQPTAEVERTLDMLEAEGVTRELEARPR